jgi:hypothetical protein
MERESPDYLSYLLRLWRVRDGQVPAWRASLKDAGTGERVGFGSVEELVEFLRAQASDTAAPGPGDQANRVAG